MIANSANLAALRVGYRTEFEGGVGATPTMRERIAMMVPSSTHSNAYGWLRDLDGMREWVGPRVIDGLAEADYTIKNKHFEKTIAVNRNDIEDDNLGQYAARFRLLGEAAAAHPEQLVWNLLKAGFDTNCWDQQFFFDTDHPVRDENGSWTVYSNTGGGSGTAWFLLCTTRSIRPIILQERKPLTFTYKDGMDDDNVFFENKFVYGADWRGAVGYGLPQLAYGSKQTLNAANYAIGRAAIMGMKGDGGRPLGLVPNLLVVPPSLEGAGRQIVQSQLVNGGESNQWAGTAELLVVPWLA